MLKPGWADYSGAAPILLPVSILHYWRGFYLPADPEDDSPDLELPEGNYNICNNFDFKNPKTDYDRACGLGGVPAVQRISVGPGFGLVFATELDPLTWWSDQHMVVNGGCLPDLSNLSRVQWSDELVWETSESEFVLMNACYHGADPDKEQPFTVELQPSRYVVQRGKYGWAGSDPALLLFRFMPGSGGGQAIP